MGNTFVTAINCMDGRAQEPVIGYMKKHFDADYVDMITEPGPVGIIANPWEDPRIASIQARLALSVHRHRSTIVAVVAHYDCAGNPVAPTTQQWQVRESVKTIKRWHPEVKVIGLWVDEYGKTSRIEP